MNNSQNQIFELKEKIHDLKEYLNSDVCRGCLEIATRLEEYIEQLGLLLNQHDAHN